VAHRQWAFFWDYHASFLVPSSALLTPIWRPTDDQFVSKFVSVYEFALSEIPGKTAACYRFGRGGSRPMADSRTDKADSVRLSRSVVESVD